MGDASRGAVVGYGTCRLKINGNVTRVLKCLHVPDLDSNLFSVTRHGRMDHGHSLFLKVETCIYLSQNFQSHNPFPKIMI